MRLAVIHIFFRTFFDVSVGMAGFCLAVEALQLHQLWAISSEFDRDATTILL